MTSAPNHPKQPRLTDPNREQSDGLDSPGWRSAVRVLDANLNRGREALRVIEDYLRFVLEDGLLAKAAKQLRHDFAEIGRELPDAARHAARDTLADVGTTIQTPQEYKRSSTAAVLIAGLKRLQESLRSLEEFSKPISADLAQRWEHLRYRAYTLERAAGLTFNSREQLASTQVYALLDGAHDPRQFADQAQRLVSAGVDAIQFRDKSLADREFLARLGQLRQLTRERPTLMIVNDRPDMAVLSRADGVHVGQDDLGLDHVRMIVGTGMLIGVSTHTIQQARQAVWDGANYLGVGPTFPSTTKAFDHFPGCDLLRAVAQEITLPAFAIGGITLQNVASVAETGFCRVAVGGTLSGDPDPNQTVSQLRRQLGEPHRQVPCRQAPCRQTP